MLLLLNCKNQPDLVSFDAKKRLIQVPNLSAARAFAFAASSSRFLDGAFVSSERRRRVEIPAISLTAAMNEASFAFDGLLKPLIFLTNCSDAARTSSAVTGGSKLKRILIFLHIRYDLKILKTLKPAPTKNISGLSDSREAPAALRRGPALVPERDSWRRRS
jgi:hypothetical protein